MGLDIQVKVMQTVLFHMYVVKELRVSGLQTGYSHKYELWFIVAKIYEPHRFLCYGTYFYFCEESVFVSFWYLQEQRNIQSVMYNQKYSRRHKLQITRGGAKTSQTPPTPERYQVGQLLKTQSTRQISVSWRWFLALYLFKCSFFQVELNLFLFWCLRKSVKCHNYLKKCTQCLELNTPAPPSGCYCVQSKTAAFVSGTLTRCWSLIMLVSTTVHHTSSQRSGSAGRVWPSGANK